MVPPRNICKVGVYIGEKGESHGVRLARGDRQTGGHVACADVLCVPCAFACVFLIPMRTIYQKLGRVRANHNINISYARAF